LNTFLNSSQVLNMVFNLLGFSKDQDSLGVESEAKKPGYDGISKPGFDWINNV